MSGNLRPCRHRPDALTRLGHHDLRQRPHATIGSPLALIRCAPANGTETMTGRFPGVVEAADLAGQSPRPPTA